VFLKELRLFGIQGRARKVGCEKMNITLPFRANQLCPAFIPDEVALGSPTFIEACRTQLSGFEVFNGPQPAR